MRLVHHINLLVPKVAKFGVLSLYVMLFIYILFFAGRRERLSVMTAREKKELVNLVPIKNEVDGFKALNQNNPEGVFDYFLNLFGNILLFIPYPFLMIGALKIRKSKIIILSALFLSIAIEVIQFIWQVGVADIDDVLLNTTGAIIGLFMYKLFIIAFRKLNRNKVSKNC